MRCYLGQIKYSFFFQILVFLNLLRKTSLLFMSNTNVAEGTKPFLKRIYFCLYFSSSLPPCIFFQQSHFCYTQHVSSVGMWRVFSLRLAFFGLAAFSYILETCNLLLFCKGKSFALQHCSCFHDKKLLKTVFQVAVYNTTTL